MAMTAGEKWSIAINFILIILLIAAGSMLVWAEKAGVFKKGDCQDNDHAQAIDGVSKFGGAAIGIGFFFALMVALIIWRDKVSATVVNVLVPRPAAS